MNNFYKLLEKAPEIKDLTLWCVPGHHEDTFGAESSLLKFNNIGKEYFF